MEISKKYYEKYLHDIAIDQIADEYRAKGYSIRKEAELGEYRADLLAQKVNENIVIEVKTGRMTPERSKQISGIADYVKSLGDYKFLVVIATKPKEKKLEIKNIESLLTQCFIEDMPPELDTLSPYTIPEEVIDVDISEIRISADKIEVKGSGVINVLLQYDSQLEDVKMTDVFPFNFELDLGYLSKKVLQIVDLKKLEIDTTSFFK